MDDSVDDSEDAAGAAGGPVARRPRRERKRAAILAAASEAFLAGGFSRTSMDEVARRAQVSKQTVYMHFGDKESLFSEVVTSIIDEAAEQADRLVGELAESDDPGRDLRAHAHNQLAGVIQPRPLQLRRLVIAESAEFPALGQHFYERGPGRSIDDLATAVGRLHDRALLDAPDPRRAATDLNWLVLAEPLNRAMLLGWDEAPADEAIRTWADQAVTTFLAAYGRRPT